MNIKKIFIFAFLLLFIDKCFAIENYEDKKIRENSLVFKYKNSNRVDILNTNERGIREYKEELENNKDIILEENYERSIMGTYNDTYYNKQWYIEYLDLEKAWEHMYNYNASGKTIKVAVIDTGVNYNHEDLQGRLCDGYNFINSNEDYMDSNGHGTAISGLISANTNNSQGIAGISCDFDIKIMGLKSFFSDGSGYISDEVNAIYYAIENGADIINLSVGGSEYSQIEHDAIQAAIDAGIVVVAASGNSGSHTYEYPASYDGVISVAANDKSGEVLYFSNRNDKVFISAPGKDIYTCNKYSYSNYRGTSFSAPIVSGCIALMKYIYKDIGIEDIKNILIDTAYDKGDIGRDDLYGYGIINIDSAIEKTIELSIYRDWEIFDTQYDIPCDKIWTIVFNKPIKQESINDNIYVLDAYNNIVTTKKTIEYEKSVVVYPYEEYEKGKKYTLYIKDIKDTYNNIIKNNVKMEFSIK